MGDVLTREDRSLLGYAAVLCGAILVAWQGFVSSAMADYPKLFARPMNALLAGHLDAFATSLPPDGAGGSLLLRAPLALLGKALGGNQLAVYRFGALPCVLALGLLGVWLSRLCSRAWIDRMAIVLVCLASPLVLGAIHFGHPEEALAAALCVGSVLLASRGSAELAGAALGLALICKPWALFAAAPVLIAAPRGGVRLTVSASVIPLLWMLWQLAVSPQALSRTLAGSGDAVVMHPFDIWWPLGRFGTHEVASPLWRLISGPGPTTAYFPPGWLASLGHELTLLVVALISIAGALRKPHRLDRALALLALLMVLRCLLDPSNFVYYELPAVVALLAWEASSSARPLLAPAFLAGLWVVFYGLDTLDHEFLAYLVLTLPLLYKLAHAVFGPEVRERQTGIVPARDRHTGRPQLRRGAAPAA